MTDPKVIEAVHLLSAAVCSLATKGLSHKPSDAQHAIDLADEASELLAAAAEKPAEPLGGWASDGWASEPAEAAPVVTGGIHFDPEGHAISPTTGKTTHVDPDGWFGFANKERAGVYVKASGLESARRAVRAMRDAGIAAVRGEAAPVATPVANVVGERERWLALADKWQADPSLDGNAAFEAGVMAVIGRVRAAAKATPAAKPVDTEDALRRERTEALDTLAEINNIAAHALDIATIHNPGPGFVKAHVERLAKEHRALRTAKPVVPVKFDASHAARGDGWHARAYNDGYISIGIQLRPGEDAGETVAKMLAACGRGL